jgi:hypothetical protein
MGLDMYLSKKTYVKVWNHQKPCNKYKVTVKKGNKNVDSIQADRITYVEEEIGYWRKANHIHNWFVQNCQDGVDDCRSAYVSVDQLEELIDLCKKVKLSLIDSPRKNIKLESGFKTVNGEKVLTFEELEVFENTSVAEELLPTQSGFFFGNTEYDQWYLESLNDTIEMLEKVLLEDNSNAEFYYRSSW